MLLFQSISKERVWGTKRLHLFNGDQGIEKIGSIYTVSGTKEIDTVIINGENEGKTLSEAAESNPELFGLKEGEEFPLIVSITSADEDLSIQVHPTDRYSEEKYERLYGKSESWYFIEPPKSGWIFANAYDLEKEDIKKQITEKNYLGVVQKTPVEKHELVYIPSGTIHALTKGSLVYEVQQSTDITYRFYDYDRVDKNGQKRELHLNDALAVIDTTKCVEKNSFGIDTAVPKYEYELTHIETQREYTNETDIAVVLTMIDGEINIDEYRVEKGQSMIVLPNERIEFAGMGEAIIAKPNTYWRDRHKS